MTSRVDLRDVSVSFPDGESRVTAIDHASFEAAPGELAVIRGASGSGKSTLLNVIAGLQAVDDGTVRVGDVDVATSGEEELAMMRLTHVGVVFQENNLLTEFSASENVQLPLRARGWATSQVTTETNAMMEAVGLGALGRRRPSQLSGGQRQRVGIARALVGGRNVLVADEPTGALDTTTSHAVFALLREFSRRGVTVIVASHDPEIDTYADRVVFISDGTIS
ncbi:ABC transporter ATP-binding protein [uncultured Microbacterium sp.]|uniref:ABC transporter ATP-binding protein n=1 Tax=uncultured Microbacterium sp. TaxID=191216 RepID=UPI0026383956|nr:ABC transporter ATP-binding protein [uncultured Microbacterium sp.]